MGTALAATLAFCLWLVLWSLDVKAIDAIIVSLLIVVTAVATRMLLPYVPGNRRR